MTVVVSSCNLVRTSVQLKEMMLRPSPFFWLLTLVAVARGDDGKQVANIMLFVDVASARTPRPGLVLPFIWHVEVVTTTIV